MTMFFSPPRSVANLPPVGSLSPKPTSVGSSPRVISAAWVSASRLCRRRLALVLERLLLAISPSASLRGMVNVAVPLVVGAAAIMELRLLVTVGPPLPTPPEGESRLDAPDMRRSCASPSTSRLLLLFGAVVPFLLLPPPTPMASALVLRNRVVGGVDRSMAVPVGAAAADAAGVRLLAGADQSSSELLR